MEIRLQKWGNSSGIRIPSTILKSLKLKVNDKVTIEQLDDKIVISKSKKEKISLSERFRNYNGDIIEDFNWDSPRGREIW